MGGGRGKRPRPSGHATQPSRLRRDRPDRRTRRERSRVLAAEGPSTSVEENQPARTVTPEEDVEEHHRYAAGRRERHHEAVGARCQARGGPHAHGPGLDRRFEGGDLELQVGGWRRFPRRRSRLQVGTDVHDVGRRVVSVLDLDGGGARLAAAGPGSTAGGDEEGEEHGHERRCAYEVHTRMVRRDPDPVTSPASASPRSNVVKTVRGPVSAGRPIRTPTSTPAPRDRRGNRPRE